MEMQKSLSYLADRLRFLKTTDKKEFLDRLEEALQNHCVQEGERQRINPFFLQSLAFRVYNLLEGRPYTQPEFRSQMTHQDIQNHKNFSAIFSGIVAYVKSSERERASFRNNVLKDASIFQKIEYLVKKEQNIRE
ncbi:MAG: hypothetical protein E7013_00180 [Alphaproteobacteria bacterium]|nr:hypothetical protein [Alphaproteobacteria bacterium]